MLGNRRNSCLQPKVSIVRGLSDCQTAGTELRLATLCRRLFRTRNRLARGCRRIRRHLNSR